MFSLQSSVFSLQFLVVSSEKLFQIPNWNRRVNDFKKNKIGFEMNS